MIPRFDVRIRACVHRIETGEVMQEEILRNRITVAGPGAPLKTPALREKPKFRQRDDGKPQALENKGGWVA